MTLQVFYRYFNPSVISDPIGNLSVFCLFQQVDNPVPTISRSGKPIDLLQSGPISLIGHHVPSLVALTHHNVRFKKTTTKWSKLSPSVAAATLAQVFTVKFLNFLCLHRFHPTLTSFFQGTSAATGTSSVILSFNKISSVFFYAFTHEILVVATANWQIG